MVKYPILNQRKVAALKSKIESPEGIRVTSMVSNSGASALEIQISNRAKGPLDNEGMDDLLSKVGLVFTASTELDAMYGSSDNHYIYKRNRTIWTAYGSHSYGEDSSRVSIIWRERLSAEKAREAGLID